MPQRLTVAGEATERSLTSNIMCMPALSLMRSPLERQSILLSSSTVFMFSIHSASTGPSKMIQLKASLSSCTDMRTSVGTRPSVHSCVTGLTSP